MRPRSNHRTNQSRVPRRLLIVTLSSLIIGCATVTDPNSTETDVNKFMGTNLPSRPRSISKDKSAPPAPPSKSSSNSDVERVANPPARTIRFDGHQAILGDGLAAAMPTEELRNRLKPLLEKGKLRSAKQVVLRNGETSERLLTERWASECNSKDIHLIAALRSDRSGANAKSNWNSLLLVAREFPAVAQEYERKRNAFVHALQYGEPDDSLIAELQKAATAVGHPIVEMDCLRLLGLREVVNEKWTTADTHYRQALAVAMRSGNQQYQADIHLLIVEAAKRSNLAVASIKSMWLQAIDNQIEIMKRDLTTVDIEFWLRMEQIFPDSKSWPENLQTAFAPHITRTLLPKNRNPSVVFWTAIAQAQMDRNEMQLGLLNLKKAESSATGDDVLWLRIAESKCLASIGQSEAAVAILSGPATSQQTAIASAATAALGSVKLQSGAYQQGAQLLNKAIKKSEDVNWPSKSNAMADLALAQLIIGSTEQGLTSLHEAQSLFQANNEVPALLQSLENELRLLEHEGKSGESTAIEERIRDIEVS